MKNRKNILLFVLSGLLLASCGIPKEQFLDLQNKHAELLQDLEAKNQKIAELEKKKVEVAALKDKVAYLAKGNDEKATLLNNQFVLSKTASENMGKTLQQLSQKEDYIQRLRSAKTAIDSLNLAVAAKLTSVLKDGINDKDIDVKVEKTVVYISISNKLLFRSGSYKVSKNASKVLGKVVDIINAQPLLDVMVEGHTDNKQVLNGSELKDNWDLSVKRSTAIVRLLQAKFKVAPSRLVAAGRSEYQPLVSNDSKEGRTTNRRTKIIILPKLDEFFQLFEMKE